MYELAVRIQMIFNMFVWTNVYGGAGFIVSVASCLVFPVFSGPLLLSEVALFDVAQSIVTSATGNKSRAGSPV